MKQHWITISALTVLGLLTVIGLGAYSIANKMDYEVLSYQIQQLDNEGVTIRVVFGVLNPSGFDVDIWNQDYDVFVAGYKSLHITSIEQYRLFAGTTSSIPLDVRLTWEQLSQNSKPVGSFVQSAGMENLPIVIKGTMSMRAGLLRLTKLPVRMAAPLSYFLP